MFDRGGLRLLHIPTDKAIAEFLEPFYLGDNNGIIWMYHGDHRSSQTNPKNGEIIYDKVYTIDRFGKRQTSLPDDHPKRNFILFFGCSYTFGTGLDDDQTLPSVVGTAAKGFQSYNFATMGDGPFDALAKVEDTDFHEQVQQEQGLIVYVFIDAHIGNRIRQVIMSEYCRGHRPCYTENPDQTIKRTGSFNTSKPIQSYLCEVTNRSNLLRLIKRKWRQSPNEKNFKMTALAINTFFKKFKERYPMSKAVLLIYPGSSYHKSFLPYLDKTIAVLDYSALFSPYGDDLKKYSLSPFDLHPSPFAIQLLADRMVQDLGLKQEESSELCPNCSRFSSE